MYTVIFSNGKVQVFTVKAAAEVFAKAYRGTLITPEVLTVLKRMSNV